MKLQAIGWLGGLLEGEGYFAFCKNGSGSGSIRIVLEMTDRDTVERAAHLLGTRTVTLLKPRNEKCKESYRCVVTGNRAAGWMMTLHPFLGSRRQGRVRELLSIWRAQRPCRSHPPKAPHSPSSEANENRAV